ncbi:MAG TPA: hypothetical protein VF881_12455, partial [Polyangiaceae bacterium]
RSQTLRTVNPTPALVLSTRNSAMFANAVVFGAGGAAGVGPHSGLAPVGAGAEPPITKRESAAAPREARVRQK